MLTDFWEICELYKNRTPSQHTRPRGVCVPRGHAGDQRRLRTRMLYSAILIHVPVSSSVLASKVSGTRRGLMVRTPSFGAFGTSNVRRPSWNAVSTSWTMPADPVVAYRRAVIIEGETLGGGGGTKQPLNSRGYSPSLTTAAPLLRSIVLLI